MILVTQYGVSGCCWNRFGNVLTFEEINRISREVMLKAKAVAESNNFRIVYGNTDALFVKKTRSKIEDYEELARKIAEETGLPMSLDRHFKFIAFLPLKSDPFSSAMNRYFGLTYDGDVECRGIELRRHDTPPFVKRFQEELVNEVLDFGSIDEVYSIGVRRGVEKTKQALSMIRKGEVDVENLVIEKTLRKNVDEYHANVAHRSAALQLLYQKKDLEIGDDIHFLYTNRAHKNPLCRVKVAGSLTFNYDKETYAKMLIEAASVIFKGLGMQLDIGPFIEKLEKWF
jgi:DNA polymerase elongation subunit (family B)